MIMSRKFYCHDERQRDGLAKNKMANSLEKNNAQQQQQQMQQKSFLASKRRLKMQARFVILLLTLSSTYRTATTSSTISDSQLANATGASNSNSSSSNSISGNDRTDGRVGVSASGFAPRWRSNSSKPTRRNDANANLSEQQARQTNASSAQLDDNHHQQTIFFGLTDYYGAMFSSNFDKFISNLVEELFELNELVELDCSKGIREPPLNATSRGHQFSSSSPMVEQLAEVGAPERRRPQRHKLQERLKRSAGQYEPELEPDATLVDSAADGDRGKRPRKRSGLGNHRVHRDASPAKRSPLQLIRSVNPTRNVTHMNVAMAPEASGEGAQSDNPTQASSAVAAAANHLQEIDQDHLYDEQANLDRVEAAAEPLKRRSNRKARRQSSTPSDQTRKDQSRYSSAPSSTTAAPSTTTATSSQKSSPQAAAIVSDQGLGGAGGSGSSSSGSSSGGSGAGGDAESASEPATASPDQSGGGVAAESGNVESPMAEMAMPQPTEQPASVFNDQDSIEGPQGQRQVDMQQQQQLQADDGGGNVQLESQVQLPSRKARLDHHRQRLGHLVAAGDNQQLPASSSGLSAQIPPPEQTPLKSHQRHNQNQQQQNQRARFLQTGALVFNDSGANKTTQDQQPQELVPQVGDAQILDHSGAGGSTKEQQLRQLLRLYELNENSLAKRLKARQPLSANYHHQHQNRALPISSVGEYASQANPFGASQRQLYQQYQQQQRFNDDGASQGASGVASPQMLVRSQAPYAVPSNSGAGNQAALAQSQSSPLQANGDSYPNLQAQSISIPQALAALDTLDGSGNGGGASGQQQAIINSYMRLNSPVGQAASLAGLRHRPGTATLTAADAASQIEENFYSSNGVSAPVGATDNKYAAAVAAAALAQLQEQHHHQQQHQQQQQEQMALNNNNNYNNVELQPSIKLRRATGSSSSSSSGSNSGGNSGSNRETPNVAANPTNRYGSRGNRATSLPTIDASQIPDHGQLVQGLLRATNPIAYGSTTASSTIQAQHSSPLLRRTSPLAALPASTNNNNQQLALLGSPYRGGTATAYLLPAGYPPAMPYSSTSARYTKQSNTNGPIHRQLINTRSQHRMGKIVNSNGAATSTGNNNNNNNNYDDQPSGSSAQPSVPSTATSDPMWSDTQNQEDDYQQAPQTIQITAVPNGFGSGLWNGGVNGFNPLVGAGWNGWGGPWNGRQVLLVNRQPSPTVGSSGAGLGSEWRQWVLPVAVILALPLILGALFVPVFLKSIMFLIQILQMLGLLMPPAQLAGHLASSSHAPSSG